MNAISVLKRSPSRGTISVLVRHPGVFVQAKLIEMLHKTAIYLRVRPPPWRQRSSISLVESCSRLFVPILIFHQLINLNIRSEGGWDHSPFGQVTEHVADMFCFV